MQSAKILSGADDEALADVLAYNLRPQGYDVMIAHDGRDGLHQACLRFPDVIVVNTIVANTTVVNTTVVNTIVVNTSRGHLSREPMLHRMGNLSMIRVL